MKVCPACSAEFGDELKFCQIDGTELIVKEEVPAEDTESAVGDKTLVMTEEPLAGDATLVMPEAPGIGDETVVMQDEDPDEIETVVRGRDELPEDDSNAMGPPVGDETIGSGDDLSGGKTMMSSEVPGADIEDRPADDGPAPIPEDTLFPDEGEEAIDAGTEEWDDESVSGADEGTSGAAAVPTDEWSVDETSSDAGWQEDTSGQEFPADDGEVVTGDLTRPEAEGKSKSRIGLIIAGIVLIFAFFFIIAAAAALYWYTSMRGQETAAADVSRDINANINDSADVPDDLDVNGNTEDLANVESPANGAANDESDADSNVERRPTPTPRKTPRDVTPTPRPTRTPRRNPVGIDPIRTPTMRPIRTPTPAGTRRPIPNIISKGVVNGRAISLPKPAYPAAARAVNAKGSVSVAVVISETGRVVSARAVSGHPLLRRASVRAARRARFRPTLLSGQPVRVSGVIVYNFQ